MKKLMLNLMSIFSLMLFCFSGFNTQAKVINKNQKESSKIKVQNKAENKNQSKVENKSQKEQPRVSVIVPVYNTEPYLRQCMDSIVNQTLKDIEIICVNDGSTDNSLKILKEYESKDPRVIVIDKEHKNAGAARNAGLKIAKGDYLVFVDSDDYAEPDYLKLMYEKIVADDADVCVCDVFKQKMEAQHKSINKKHFFNSYLIPNKVFSYKDIPENFFQFTNSVPWNKMIKKELVIQNNLRFQEIKSFNDQFFIKAVLIKASRITTLKKALFTHRFGMTTNIQSTLHKSPYCFLDATSKLYKYLVDQKTYDVLELTFIKEFIGLSAHSISKLKCDKNLYIKAFNMVKKELGKYKIKEKFNNLDSELKQKAEFFLSSTAEQAYEKVAPKRREIPIAMAMDNNYVLPTIVSMTSMLENANKKSFYKYYLLVSEDFADENKNKFLSLQRKYSNKCEIKFINMDDAYKHDKICSWFTTAMYYRLSLPSLLEDKDKCIYIDGDTIVNKDLSELYDLNIDEYYLAGVKAAEMIQKDTKRAKFLDIPNMKKYINSGVLLMNLKKMRDEKVEDKFSKCIKEKVNTTKRLTCPDQDVINAVCYDKIKILPFKYNFITKYLVDKLGKYEVNPKIINCFSFKERNEAKNNSAIVHYAGPKKPWKEFTPYYSEWWKYAEKSPVYEEIERTYRLNSELKNKLENSNTQRDKANKNRQKAA